MPHGSPGNPESRTLATLAPGSGWVQVTYFHLDTRDQFGTQGRSERFFADGRLVLNSLIATAATGLIDGVEGWVQVSGHLLRYAEVSGARERAGLGDARLFLRLGPQLVGVQTEELPIAFAVRGGVKVPAAEFPVDAQLIPLTEGQRDWEFMLEFGKNFQPVPVYAVGWIGYRWREQNTRIDRDPGDERFAYLAVGGNASALTWELALQGLWGQPPRHLGVELMTARRKMLEVFPTIGYPVGPGHLELGGRIPITGRNFPGGNALTLGYFLSWGEL